MKQLQMIYLLISIATCTEICQNAGWPSGSSATGNISMSWNNQCHSVIFHFRRHFVCRYWDIGGLWKHFNER